MGDNFQRKKLLLPAGEQVSSSVKVYERCFVVQSKSRTFLPYSLILFPYQTFGTIPLCVRLRFHRSKEKNLKISALFDMGLETKYSVLFWRKICCCSDEDGEWSWENRSSAGNKIMFSLSITTSSSSSYDDDNDDHHHDDDDDLWPDKAVPASLLWCWGDAGEQGLVKKILIFKKNYLQLDAHPPPVE